MHCNKGWNLNSKTSFPILLFLFVVSFTQSYSQQFSIGNPFTRLYCNVDNPLEPVVEGYNRKNILIKASCGELTRKGDRWNYRSAVPCDVIFKFYIKRKNGWQLLGQTGTTVRQLPTTVSIGGYSKDSIPLGTLKAQMGVAVEQYLNPYHSTHLSVTSFSVIILKANEMVFHHFNNQQYFDEEVKTAYRNLTGEEKLIICNIRVLGADGIEKQVSPLELQIRK